MAILQNRVITIYNRKTSMRLAGPEWQILDHICYAEKMKRKNLLELIDHNRHEQLGLTAAVRLFELRYLDMLAHKNSLGYAVAYDHRNLEIALRALSA